LRVVQLLPELNEGGVERGVVELNREFVRRGIESVVISAGGKQSAQIIVDGGRHIQLDVCSKNPFTAPARVLRLRSILRRLKPDIIHARSRVPAWLAYLANKKLHLPFVTTVHGFNSVNAYSRVMTYGDRVICVSHAIKNYVQHHYQVPDEKIVVIPRGVDLDLFDPANVDQQFVETFREQYGLNGRIVVSAVGRITQLKDYETFIRSIALAKDSLPTICGLIVGGVRSDKQDYYKTLLSMVEELGLEECIRFVGSQSKIAEIYALSSLLVSCSKKPESFGRTAAEALAMNIPVIATNHGGVVDIVKVPLCGQLVEPGDESGLAGRMLELLNRDSQVLRGWVEQEFSLESMVARNLQLYRSFGEN